MEEIYNNEIITYNEPINNTPFRMIGNDKLGYCITVGQHRLTEFHDKETLYNILGDINWNFIAAFMYSMHESIRKSEGLPPLK